MPARPCPTCTRTNCGNHAACTRRSEQAAEQKRKEEEARCKRCSISPCYDREHCLNWTALFTLIAAVDPLFAEMEPDLKKRVELEGLAWTEALKNETRVVLADAWFRAVRQQQMLQSQRAFMRASLDWLSGQIMPSGHKHRKVR